MRRFTWILLGAALLLPLWLSADPCHESVEAATAASPSGQLAPLLVTTFSQGLFFALGGAAALVVLSVVLAGMGVALITLQNR